MYQIEEENPYITRYINDVNDKNIYRIHPTVYIGFEKQLYRQYRDTLWVDASDYIESLEKDYQDQIFIVKEDENFRYKSFFLIKKSNVIENGCILWECMIYVIKNQEDIPPIISSCSFTCY
jgi:hypothetical protein